MPSAAAFAPLKVVMIGVPVYTAVAPVGPGRSGLGGEDALGGGGGRAV